MEKKTLYIYMLVDPRNDKPFYVGRTVNPESRYRDHIRDGKQYMLGMKGKIAEEKCEIIEAILTGDLLPAMRILDNCTIHHGWKNEGSRLSIIHRIMNSFEEFWAAWVEQEYGVWLTGKPLSIGRSDELQYYIERYKYWIETRERPKRRKVDHKKSLEHMSKILEDLEKMRAGKPLW